MRFFNYNWFSIFKNNFRNNKYSVLKDKSVFNFIFVKEICSIFFLLLCILITCLGSYRFFDSNSFFSVCVSVLRENFITYFIWFVFLSILPFVSCFFFKGNIKNKFYLFLIGFYFLSNVFYILMLIYFIMCFVSFILLSILGIICVVVSVIVNCNIIIKINENYLVH